VKRRGRAQPLAAIVVVVVVAAGGVYVQRVVGPAPAEAAPPGTAPSGAWFCPHGGGSDWEVVLHIANPGDDPVRVRLRSFGERKPAPAESYFVEPQTGLAVPVAAEDRGQGTVVEYFGGWVAAGWVAHAGGDEGGVAAEPCLPGAGRRWLVPDGTTETKLQDSYMVVMNPFAVDAVLTVTLFTEQRRPIRTEVWSNFVLPAERSVAFHLNEKALGERTVSAEVVVSVGRVAAASLGVSVQGGIRSAVGHLGSPPGLVILPGGGDQGRTDLVVVNPGAEKAEIGALLHGRDAQQAVGSLEGATQGLESATTYPVATEGPSTIELRAGPAGFGVAAVRRTFGVSSDQGATAGSTKPTAFWVVLPAVAGAPYNPRLFLANPGADPIDVTLSLLPSEVGAAVPAPILITVPAGRTVSVPGEFLDGQPPGAVLAVAAGGTFVPVAASYSLGREGFATYAVAIGVPIPHFWMPV